MKKFLFTLALTGMCIFGLTACGNKDNNEDPYSVEQAREEAEEIMANLEEFNYAYKTGQIDPAAVESDPVLSGYISSMEEVGGYIKIVEDSVTITGSEDDIKVAFKIEGTKRNATVELTTESITVSPDYALSELMSKAGMNTLMGMGTVFAVLILIMILIYFLGWISPKIERAAAAISAAVSSFFARWKEKRAAKKAAKKAARDTSAAVDNTIAQIIKNEELSDDTELVAVIAAAVAAYEGTSADGVVIRSIRRASTNKWQRA